MFFFTIKKNSFAEISSKPEEGTKNNLDLIDFSAQWGGKHLLNDDFYQYSKPSQTTDPLNSLPLALTLSKTKSDSTFDSKSSDFEQFFPLTETQKIKKKFA